MIEWKKVSEELPNHRDTILVYNGKAFCVAIFIDVVKVNKELSDANIEFHDFTGCKETHFFCSQEVDGNTLHGTTHWKYLIPPSENYNG